MNVVYTLCDFGWCKCADRQGELAEVEVLCSTALRANFGDMKEVVRWPRPVG